MCSARVDPAFIIQAFLSGFDGVMVLGCHLGDCHYIIGNYHAQIKMRMTKRLLEIVGVNPDRLYLDWVSAAEGERFAQLVTKFTREMEEIGPLNRGGALSQRLQAAKMTVEGERIRWLVGKGLSIMEEGNVFGQKISPKEFETLLYTALWDEYVKNRIALLLEEGPKSVREIATAIGLSQEATSSYLVDLEEGGDIALLCFEGRTPKYRKVG